MKQVFTSLLILTLCFGKTENLFAQINLQDSLALVDFYDSTKGPNWKHNTNWLTAAPVSTWYGVTVENKRVVALHLSANGVGGKIPSTLGNLFNLQSIYFGSNHIHDTIPSSLGNLSNLTVLHLDQNKLKGSIPPSLSNLSKLIDLWLNSNRLSGHIPSSLGNLSSLITLLLDDNRLSGHIPSSLGNLSNLTKLYLDENQLSGNIPSSLGNLSQLIYLDLVYNRLSGNIPSSLGNLSHLQSLSLYHNKLSDSIPSSLGNLSNLQRLFLNDNQLSGTIPSSLDSLPCLYELDGNKFTFAGMEGIVQMHSFIIYSPQANIPVIKRGKTLSVNAGGTLSNNTYSWYKDGVLITSKNGDSVFTPIGAGTYRADVTNSICTQLTLHSANITINFAGDKDIASKASGTKAIIYPNPANEFINLKLDKPANKNTCVMIYDMQKKMMMQQAIAAGSLTQRYSISNLSSGNYILMISENGKRIHEKSFTIAR